MLTRSSKSKQISIPCDDIDFTGASKDWLSNKKKTGNGTYEYTNEYIKTNSKYRNKKLTHYERMLLSAEIIPGCKL